jgi:hypothetical protein
MYVAFDPIANRIIDMDSLHLHSLGGENTSLGDSLKFQGIPSHIQFFDYLHMKEPWWVVLKFQILWRYGLIMESKRLGPNSKLGYHLLRTKATFSYWQNFCKKRNKKLKFPKWSDFGGFLIPRSEGIFFCQISIFICHCVAIISIQSWLKICTSYPDLAKSS